LWYKQKSCLYRMSLYFEFHIERLHRYTVW
jgi:hypothetical protein